jgi:hypothetical protein
MSKYLDQLTKQLEGKNIKAFTEELIASQNLKKILKDQNEAKRKQKVNAEIQKLIRI